jgi:Asp-tRNA(Asn)/Glu-tRNA(Gln) amidotransferase C subunit
MRDDVCIPSLLREKALINAPDASENFYRVLRIIE